MATMGGARVLGLERQIGSLEEGKRADVIAITLKNSHAVPLMDNLYAQLVYAGMASDVEDVFINGKQIVSGRQVMTVDVEDVYGKAREYRHRISASLKN
jgi:5-methylthioadenosine/S-adenosylhomocysteine deaminase